MQLFEIKEMKTLVVTQRMRGEARLRQFALLLYASVEADSLHGGI